MDHLDPFLLFTVHSRHETFTSDSNIHDIFPQAGSGLCVQDGTQLKYVPVSKTRPYKATLKYIFITPIKIH